MNMACVTCHTAENHQIQGRYYGVSSSNTQRVTCEQCHTSVPHTNSKINEHTIKVACQTCHIPVYAKVNATKTAWDWSTATQRKDGLPYELLDTSGNETYTSIKGGFHWERMVKPEYIWFNGTADHHMITEKINLDNLPLNINTLNGEYRDRNSKIYPTKIHRGKQPYDPVYLTIIQAKLWDKEVNKGALWVDLDWEAALRTGMEYLDLPYSGTYDFIPTQLFLPVNHMVSLASESVSCSECHTRKDGRLNDLRDFYMPGRDYHVGIDTFGKLMIIFSFIGVLIHGTIRVFASRKNQIK